MYTEFFNVIYGTVEGLPVIAIGALTHTGYGGFEFIVVEMDGHIKRVGASDFIADSRFEDGAWHDVSPGPERAEED